MSATELLQRALELPEDERTELAHQILQSVKSGPDNPEWLLAWTDEIDRRLGDTAGDLQATEWEDAIARMRQSLHRRFVP